VVLKGGVRILQNWLAAGTDGNLWRLKCSLQLMGEKKKFISENCQKELHILTLTKKNEIYFSGIKFLYKKKTKDFHYEIAEKIQMSKEEFYENVKSFTEIF
jgi:hypothetical protein